MLLIIHNKQTTRSIDLEKELIYGKTRVICMNWSGKHVVNWAALYRLIAYYKMTDLIDTHISLRLPHEPEAFFD